MNRNAYHVVVVLALLFASAFASGITIDQRKAVATSTANGAQACVNIQPFYWELGESTGVVVNGMSGGNTYLQTTPMNIASATKWMYAAYVAEKLAQYYAYYDISYVGTAGGPEPVPSSDVQFLTMTSGYHSLVNSTCEQVVPSQTVKACAGAPNGEADSGYNNYFTADDVGHFWYNGGHFQVHATGGQYASTPADPTIYPPPFMVSLGSLYGWQPTIDTDELGTAITTVLGLTATTDPGANEFRFTNPMLAGGVKTTSIVYGQFLRKILDGSLRIGKLLGTHAVSDVCADGSYDCTPIPPPPVANEVWHYSPGHWVEDAPAVGDGAFSSGGAHGYYPWIWLQPRPGDMYGGWTTPIYGIVARDEATLVPTGPFDVANPDESIGWTSVLCGREIRHAFLTGVQQP